ncbi:MAG: caspase family protein [Chitinophagales bacterium]
MNALALIVGNAEYALAKNKLINAVNDAEDFGKKLLSLGFIVKTVTNTTVEEFDRAIHDFGEELKKFDVGLFYFSGHGLQIDGKNFLTAINSNFTDAISAKHTSIPLDEIIDYMQKANPIIKIIILDACRDNPLPNQYRSTQIQGLAPIHAPKGTIIAFSTSPGEKALDYGSGRNSIYTGSLLNHIDDTNIPIEDFFKRVRTSVFAMSNGKQTSWEHTSLIGDFYFNSGQLIHSIDLPYSHEYVADQKFQSSGSDIHTVIQNLKSHNYYEQKAGIEKLKNIDPNNVDDNSLFLLGRNILQSAIGGEFSANAIIKRLDTWLQRYSIGGVNHVLNGILYEIYFNSKGQFRQSDFKSQLIDEIFKLQTDNRYTSSFAFIQKQLEPFKDLLFYIPSNPPTALPIEVTFECLEIVDWEDEKQTIHQLRSIKYKGNDLIKTEGDDRLGNITLDMKEFEDKICNALIVPNNMLRLTINADLKDIKTISLPWRLKLSRQK